MYYPNHKNANMGSSTVHLHGVDLIDCKFKTDSKNIFLHLEMLRHREPIWVSHIV